MTETEEAKYPCVYKGISRVTEILAAKGIGKDKKNPQHGYMYRGIDDVYDVLSSALVESGLVIIPRVLTRYQTERESKQGGVIFYTVVEVEFRIVSVEDGSDALVVTYGEAMDSSDKSTNKAMSAAYKYMAFMTFCIPVEGEDSEKDTHEVKTDQKRQVQRQAQQKPQQESSSRPENKVGKAHIDLYNELAEYCNGDKGNIELVLQEVSFYEQGGKEYFIKNLEMLNKVSEKWAGATLGKLRARVAKDKGMRDLKHAAETGEDTNAQPPLLSPDDDIPF